MGWSIKNVRGTAEEESPALAETTLCIELSMELIILSNPDRRETKDPPKGGQLELAALLLFVDAEFDDDDDADAAVVDEKEEEEEEVEDFAFLLLVAAFIVNRI